MLGEIALIDPAASMGASKGHQRMDVDPFGGYIKGSIDLGLISEVRGLYIPTTRPLEIVVGPGNAVSQQNMRVACALRLDHREIKPATDRIDHIAYVFMDRHDAEAHLHELRVGRPSRRAHQMNLAQSSARCWCNWRRSSRTK